MPAKPITEKASGVAAGVRRTSTKAATTTSRPNTTAAEEPAVAAMSVYGTPSDFLAISSTTASLTCGIGEDRDEHKVLVPYLQLRFKKPDDLDVSSLADATFSNAFEGTLAYENVAYLLMDLARDFRGATRHLEAFSSGTLKPEMSRLRYCSDCLQSARRSIDTTLSRLEELISPGEGQAKPSAPRVRIARPKPATPK